MSNLAGIRGNRGAASEGEGVTENALLSAVGIQKDFESPGGTLQVLRGVDLVLRKGEMVFVIGRSGAGKSTLLYILASLEKPTQGSVFFEGRNIASLREKELAHHRNRKVGFIFQFYYLLPELSLLENVMLPAWMARRRGERDKALSLLGKIGLRERAHHFPNQLSGGEQQRAAIARALINDPQIVFCDEPTGNLDDETAEDVFKLIVHLNQGEGRTFCIVTHEESLTLKGHRVYYLHEGRLALRN